MKKYWNEEMETISEEKLRPLHEEKFKKQLAYTYENSQFYQRKFKEAGITIDDIKSLDDLKKLPFTEKDELRISQQELPPLGYHVTCPEDKIMKVYSTSGTSGVPVFIGLTKHDEVIWNEAGARAQYSIGFRPGSKVVLAVGTSFFGAHGFQAAIMHMGSTLIPIGAATDRIIDAFQHLKADCLLATPSYCIYLLDQLSKKGIDPLSLGLKTILVGGEPGGSDPTWRKKVEESFNASASETMGIGEMILQAFAECEKQQGMHYIAQGLIHIELIDPDTEKPIEFKDGVFGEMVFTALDKECMPLLRYRTRDHVQVWTSPCECGRTGFRIKIMGRTDDMMFVLGVNVYPSAIRDVIASLAPRTTGAIEILIDKPLPKVEPPVRIRVEYGKGVLDSDLPDLKKKIEELIREKLIFRSDVELVPEGTIPRYDYKGKLIRKLYEEKQ